MAFRFFVWRKFRRSQTAATGKVKLVSRGISIILRDVIYDASLDELLQKVWDGQRINAAEALRLYHLPLEELGALAGIAAGN